MKYGSARSYKVYTSVVVKPVILDGDKSVLYVIRNVVAVYPYPVFASRKPLIGKLDDISVGVLTVQLRRKPFFGKEHIDVDRRIYSEFQIRKQRRRTESKGKSGGQKQIYNDGFKQFLF